MSNQNQTLPNWVQSIRNGDFSSAEESLVNEAAQRLHIAQEAQRIEQSSPYSQYIKGAAIQKLTERVQRGEVRNVQEAMRAYGELMEHETEQFKQTVRPGYQRSQYDPYEPASKEVEDYCQERRQRQQELKDEGRRIATIGRT